MMIIIYYSVSVTIPIHNTHNISGLTFKGAPIGSLIKRE